MSEHIFLMSGYLTKSWQLGKINLLCFTAFRIVCFRDGRTMSTTIRVPDTITDWSIQGLAFSKKGFCASDPVFIRAFKDLFVECHLPFSLRRREQITIACTVYNYREPGVISTKVCQYCTL